MHVRTSLKQNIYFKRPYAKYVKSSMNWYFADFAYFVDIGYIAYFAYSFAYIVYFAYVVYFIYNFAYSGGGDDKKKKKDKRSDKLVTLLLIFYIYIFQFENITELLEKIETWIKVTGSSRKLLYPGHICDSLHSL